MLESTGATTKKYISTPQNLINIIKKISKLLIIICFQRAVKHILPYI
jgi:hypothetical protein